MEAFLEAASHDYCSHKIKFGKKHVILPMLFYWFESDFLSFRSAQRNSEEACEEEEESTEDLNYDERDMDMEDGDATTLSSILLPFSWMTKRQALKLQQMEEEGNIKVVYEYDWAPALALL